MISYFSNYNNFKTQVVQKFGCLDGAFCPIRNEECSGFVCGMHKDLNLVSQKGLFTHLLQVELVGEHPLAVVALCRLPGLPIGASVGGRRAFAVASARRRCSRLARDPGSTTRRPIGRLSRSRNCQISVVVGGRRGSRGCSRNSGGDCHQGRSVVFSDTHLSQRRRKATVDGVAKESVDRVVVRAEPPVGKVKRGRVLRRLSGRRRRDRRRSLSQRPKGGRRSVAFGPEHSGIRNVEKRRHGSR